MRAIKKWSPKCFMEFHWGDFFLSFMKKWKAKEWFQVAEKNVVASPLIKTQQMHGGKRENSIHIHALQIFTKWTEYARPVILGIQKWVRYIPHCQVAPNPTKQKLAMNIGHTRKIDIIMESDHHIIRLGFQINSKEGRISKDFTTEDCYKKDIYRKYSL